MKIQRVFLLSIIISVLAACVSTYYPTDTSTISKVLEFKDRAYESEIRTIKITPQGNLPYTKYPTPIIPLNSQTGLRLEFDDLRDESDYYILKLKYLNSVWEESYVNSIEYLSEYNEFRINDYELSLNTKIKYVHYGIDIPSVKLPGNYLAIVYREGNEDDIVLSRRFIVFSNDAIISGPDQLTAFTQFRGQTVDFNVFYRDLPVEDPYNQIRATIRQNGRWDNSIQSLAPTFVKEDQGKLEFRYFDNSNAFSPGNEFRYFDIRSIIAPGQFVKAIEREPDPVNIYIQKDKPRTGLAYTFYRDLNGGFEVINFDAGNSSSYSDYINVNFELELDHDGVTRQLYIFGELTNWQLLPEARLRYNSTSKSYQSNLLLKQGWYDYQYYQLSPGNKHNVIEGDFIDTENYYEVLIYFKPIGRREELCVGYFQFGVNERIR